MRRLLIPAILLAAAASVGCGERTTTTTNATTNANAAAPAAANANGANSNGAREGVGPHGQGIGGTSEANRNAAVSGNSNVEPTGVNRNAGSTPAANRNR